MIQLIVTKLQCKHVRCATIYYFICCYVIFSLGNSLRDEIEQVEDKLKLLENFDQELYTQSEVLDNLEQILESQNFPWNLSENGETCTLMVS